MAWTAGERWPVDCAERLEERVKTRSFVCFIPRSRTSFRAGTLKLHDPGGILQGSRSASCKDRACSSLSYRALTCHDCLLSQDPGVSRNICSPCNSYMYSIALLWKLGWQCLVKVSGG